MSQQPILTLPNVVSLSRIGLAAAFVALPEHRYRVALILVATLTDVLDGWLARWSNASTRLGALIDPVADRIFVFVALIVFLVDRLINPMQYFIIIFRDVMTAIGFIVARSVTWLRPITFRARAAGKVVTALQLLTLVAVLIRREWLPALLIALAVSGVYATIDYTLLLWRERERTSA